MHAYVDEMAELIRSSIVITTSSSRRYRILKRQWMQRDWVRKWCIWIGRMSINLRSGTSRRG